MTQVVPLPLLLRSHTKAGLAAAAMWVLTACTGGPAESVPDNGPRPGSSWDSGMHPPPTPPLVSAVLTPADTARFVETLGNLAVGTVVEAQEQPYLLEQEGLVFEFRGYRIVVADARGDEMTLIGILGSECAHVQDGGVTRTLCLGGPFPGGTVLSVGEVIAFMWMPQGGMYEGTNAIMVHAVLMSSMSVGELETTLLMEFAP